MTDDCSSQNGVIYTFYLDISSDLHYIFSDTFTTASVKYCKIEDLKTC